MFLRISLFLISRFFEEDLFIPFASGIKLSFIGWYF
jgi:hypothetical protein